MIAEVPVGLLGRSGVEMALVELGIGRHLLEPGFELGEALNNAVVCSLVDHGGDDGGRRLTKR